MTREELIALVQRVYNGEGAIEDGNVLVAELDKALPNGEIWDLIYWPRKPMTPEEVVDEALRRGAEWRRIQL
ncbi:hypothetical protein [Terricaulis sp.]|uniref:hypothetical protein n=1 Tax=Terricaulis sp. TaxID=2768686 RepID=UPI002AC37D1A|nr:hypothetical protein [Terricaulis sp.]MDZ4690661.1 hypothetical protein [Terricaulis sp.]